MHLGNIALEALSPKKIKKRFICSTHFNKNDYSDPSAKKSRLKPNAVPKKYSGNKEFLYPNPILNMYLILSF